MSDQKKNNEKLKPMPEQITYANLLFWGCWIGIFLMILTYFIYVTGILPSFVAPDTVQLNWDQGVQHYLEVTGAPTGWGWLRLLNMGDYLNFIGIALLAVMTIVCYLILLPGYIRRKNYIYASIVVVEVLVLTLAASGILDVGGH